MFGFKKIKENILKIYFFIAPFAVSNTVQNLFGSIPLTIVFQILTFTLLFMFTSKIYLKKIEKKIIMLYLFPIFLSLFSLFINLNFKKNEQYLIYLQEDLVSRVILIILNIGILIFALTITHKYSFIKIKKIIKFYYFGLGTFLFIGIWQFLSYTINIPYINLQTRNKIHSVSPMAEFIIKKRLTSIADEPSYLAPLIIDFMILTFIFNKNIKIKLIISLIILIFTYSGGGYINLVLLILLAVLLNSKYRNSNKIQMKNLIMIILLLPIVLLIFIKFINIFEPILARTDNFFNINQHERLYMLLYSFIWPFSEGALNFLFGLGVGSYKYLNLVKVLPTGRAVHVTSNNLFTDTVVELGYIGLVYYIYIFIILLKIFFKKIKNNKLYFIGIILTFHLIITSLYRGDYMQPRFWILMFIIFKIIDTERKNENNNSNTNL